MRNGDPIGHGGSRGSALIMAVFVLALITGMGTALLFLSQHEARMGRSGLRAKQAFYLAEAGIEDGRMTLYNANSGGVLSPELAVAAGADGVIDFDPQNVQLTFSSDGRISAISGFDDDVPIRAMTTLTDPVTNASGSYVAFLTNDPLEGTASVTDNNGRVMLTSLGGTDGTTVEMVQAVVEPYRYIPELPAAAITMVGPLPVFDNGNSAAQAYSGSDCGVGGGAYAPIIGTTDPLAADAVKTGMNCVRPTTFVSGPFSCEDTVGDLTDPTDPIVIGANQGTIEPSWTDCDAMKAMVINLMNHADYYCNTDDPGGCSIPSPAAPDEVIFIDGDVAGTPAGNHAGILVVTGSLVYKGNTAWDGILLVIGEGLIDRSGGGNFTPSGAMIVANIDPTPDGPNADKSDWCTTPPDGFGQAEYETSGAGTSEVEWCTGNIASSNSIRNYKVVEFLQR